MPALSAPRDIGDHRLRGLTAVAVITCAVTLAGCSSSSDDASAEQSESSTTETSATETSAAAPAGAECTPVSAPLTPIDASTPGEPQLLIPQPPGWEPNTSLNNQIIRYALANTALTAASFTPNAVVTLEHVPGTDITPQQVLEQQRTALESQAGATDLEVETTSTCGSAAEIVSYTLPAQGAVAAHPAKVLLIAAPYAGDTWSATVTVQAINADDPTYQQDASTILTGFQMKPPAGA